LLRAIDQNILLGKLTPADIAGQDEMLYGQDDLINCYEDYPAIIKNTERLIEDSTISLDASIKNRKTFTGTPYDDKLLLEKLAREGFAYRYPDRDKRAKGRLEKELDVIDRLGFSAYFLITLDIVRYAKMRGYYHVGRGSGANSLLAFCLQITDVDPMQLDLYFERFINPMRTSPPDFDIDFSWDERDDVTDYVFKRYGSEYTALLATYKTFQGRSTTREVTKTFGLPKEGIDKIINQSAEKHKHHGLADTILKCDHYLEGFPNYLSIHAGGIIISEKPINYFTALQMMPKGFPIVHFDMHTAEDLGFHKYDILSQRGLGHIKDAVDIISKNKGVKIDIHKVREVMQDEKVKKQWLCSKNRVLNIFQF
jgi:DNA polymerase-3 subunit alpha